MWLRKKASPFSVEIEMSTLCKIPSFYHEKLSMSGLGALRNQEFYMAVHTHKYAMNLTAILVSRPL